MKESFALGSPIERALGLRIEMLSGLAQSTQPVANFLSSTKNLDQLGIIYRRITGVDLSMTSGADRLLGDHSTEGLRTNQPSWRRNIILVGALGGIVVGGIIGGCIAYRLDNDELGGNIILGAMLFIGGIGAMGAYVIDSFLN